jgi:hypothetical protein
MDDTKYVGICLPLCSGHGCKQTAGDNGYCLYVYITILIQTKHQLKHRLVYFIAIIIYMYVKTDQLSYGKIYPIVAVIDTGRYTNIVAVIESPNTPWLKT